MLRALKILLLAAAAGAPAGAAAQGTGAPLPLGTARAAAPAPHAPVKLPANWRLLTMQPDPLTGQTLPQVMTAPKANPVIDGKSVTTALVVRCSSASKGLPDPQLIVVFGSLTGVGHFKTFDARYRFDEGPVHAFAAQSVIGKNHARAIVLPRYLDVSDNPTLAKLVGAQGQVDPGIEIAGASRLRMEFNFKSAGAAVLDFNVSGATQAISALGCR
jgi:hypothetical protein